MKNFCCNRAYKSYDDFEIAFQLFQEYADSVDFSLIFKDFVQKLKFITDRYSDPQGHIFFANCKSVRMCCETFWTRRYQLC